MKKILVVALVVAMGVPLGSMAYATWSSGPGPGPGSQADVKALRSFQKETLPLRDELAAKRLEIQNEFVKDNPDQTRIATLQKEMIDLRAKIRDAAQKQGLSDRGSGWMMGYGGRDHGYMMGRGYGRGGRSQSGYGSGYCPGW